MPTELSSEYDPAFEGRYFMIGDQDQIIPLDPISGEPLRPNTPPESLLTDPNLERGFRFLRENAHRIKMGLLLSAHESRNDFEKSGIDMRAEALELAQNKGILFVEGVSEDQATQEVTERCYNYLSSLDKGLVDRARTVVESGGVGNEFCTETLLQTIGTGVKVVLPDFRRDTEEGADKTLTEWRSSVPAVVGNEMTVENIDDILETYQAVNLGYTIYRNWYFIGKIGSYLADNPLPIEEDIHIKLLIGSNHITVGEDMEYMGSTVQYIGQYPDRPVAYDAFVNGVRKAEMTMDDRLTFAGGGIPAEN